jgi:crossover junction endodeoxyribonuclease RuvC
MDNSKPRVSLQPQYRRAYGAIDPGVSGAVSIIASDGAYAAVRSLPTYKVGRGKRSYRRLAYGDVHDLLMEVNSLDLTNQGVFFLIEDVWAISKQGVNSTFTFGEAVGALRMALAACGFPHTVITPGTWKKHFRLTNKPKEESIAMAVGFYPDLRKDIGRDHNKADALLMAAYARANWMGE